MNIGGSSFTDCSFRERLERQIKGGGGSEGGMREREGGERDGQTDRQKVNNLVFYIQSTISVTSGRKREEGDKERQTDSQPGGERQRQRETERERERPTDRDCRQRTLGALVNWCKMMHDTPYSLA